MLLGFIIVLLLVDLLVFHREAHEVRPREAAIESAVWISIGFGVLVRHPGWFGGAATGEYISGYLIEKSLSVDNVFVWALLMSYFRCRRSTSTGCCSGASSARSCCGRSSSSPGIALIERSSWMLYVFGGFLLFTAVPHAGQRTRPQSTRRRAGSSGSSTVSCRRTDKFDGRSCSPRVNGRRLATPLFAVLLLVEATDVIFAVDSVPAVLAVSHEQFIVFSSNAFAILGLRALYFLLADMHARFTYLQQAWPSSWPSSGSR